MRVSDWTDRIESLGQNLWTKWGVWGLYTLIVIFLCSIHEPWEDEHHVWSMVYQLSFSELWDAMRVEGHFCLWHLCVWPWVRMFGMDYHALFVTSTLLMSGAVWMMLFKLDFSFIGKLFIIFSAPFFYYFPVIARCYALIPPILVALAVVYQRQRNPYLYCLLIGLLAHTHAYMEGMVAVLWCLFVYYNVYIPYRHGDIERAKRNGYASLITIVLVLFAFVQIMGGIVDAANGNSVALHRVNSHDQWIMYAYGKHHIQLTTTLHQYISFIPKIDIPITLSLYVLITILVYKVISISAKKVEYLWILSVSIIWQILFALNIYCMWYQRVYLLFLPLFYVLWIIYDNDKTTKRYVSYICICIWLLNTPAQYDILHDIKKTYSYDVAASQQIVAHIKKSNPIIDCYAICGGLIKAEKTFLPNVSTLDSVINNKYCDVRELYVISPTEIDESIVPNHHVECICTTIEDTDDFTDCGNRKHEVRLYNLVKK